MGFQAWGAGGFRREERRESEGGTGETIRRVSPQRSMRRPWEYATTKASLPVDSICSQMFGGSQTGAAGRGLRMEEGMGNFQLWSALSVQATKRLVI